MPIVGTQDYNPQSENYQNSSIIQEKNDKSDNLHFVGREPFWTIDEIILDDETKSQLNDAVVYLQKKKTIIDEWNLKRFLKGSRGCTGINMYGKPGTGKSIAAEAIANAADMKIIKVDYSEIQNDKWGGTERQLTTLFKNASQTNSVIFFDEADSLLGKRQSNGANSETNNQIKAHLLTLLDEYDVVVFFATNLFENYDRAFFRRILFHINFRLPGEKELQLLWKFHLGSESDSNKVPRSDKFSFEQLAKDSIGLSGGDIKNITLKSCIHLVSKDVNALTNEIVLHEIEIYKKSLSDMDTSSTFQQGRILNGEEAKRADEIFKEKDNNEQI